MAIKDNFGLFNDLWFVRVISGIPSHGKRFKIECIRVPMRSFGSRCTPFKYGLLFVSRPGCNIGREVFHHLDISDFAIGRPMKRVMKQRVRVCSTYRVEVAPGGNRRPGIIWGRANIATADVIMLIIVVTHEAIDSRDVHSLAFVSQEDQESWI